MTSSRTENGSVIVATFATAVSGTTKSVTYYQGGPGEEQSDYTYKYAASSIADTTTYFYPGNSGECPATTPMTSSRKGKVSSIAPTVSTAVSGTTKSVTYYQGGPGEE